MLSFQRHALQLVARVAPAIMPGHFTPAGDAFLRWSCNLPFARILDE